MVDCIVENFQGRKPSQIGEKDNFREENFRGMLAIAAPKKTMPENFAEKTFVNSHKTAKFAKVFSLKVSHYAEHVLAKLGDY